MRSSAQSSNNVRCILNDIRIFKKLMVAVKCISSKCWHLLVHTMGCAPSKRTHSMGWVVCIFERELLQCEQSMDQVSSSVLCTIFKRDLLHMTRISNLSHQNCIASQCGAPKSAIYVFVGPFLRPPQCSSYKNVSFEYSFKTISN